MNIVAPRYKNKKDHLFCFQQIVQKPAYVVVWDWVCTYDLENMHICESSIKAERYKQVLKQEVLPSKQRLFLGCPRLFQQDNVKTHFEQRGF